MERLNRIQRAALEAIDRAALSLSGDAERRIGEILQRNRIGEPLYLEAWKAVRERARVVVQFHPDRITRSGLSVIDSMLESGSLTTQFESGVSNGSLTPFAGGPRDGWERRLFDGAYQRIEAGPGDRPKYGALDLTGFSDGPAPRFGSCFFRLKPELGRVCSFTDRDSHQEPETVGTLARFDAIFAVLLARAEAGETVLGLERPGVEGFLKRLARLADRPVGFGAEFGRTLDDYVEAQIHGPVRLECDVERLTADPSFIGTETGRSLERACEKYKIVLDWHAGFILESSRVPGEFRGPRVAELACRVAEDGMITAAVIGRAAVSLARDPAAWADWGTFAETLQQIKQLWHVLAAFGKPLCENDGKLTATMCRHLLQAVGSELQRLGTVEAGCGDDWPAGFDRNDIPLFETVLAAVKKSEQAPGANLELTGKPLSFLLDAVPGFVHGRLGDLSGAERRALLAWATAMRRSGTTAG